MGEGFRPLEQSRQLWYNILMETLHIAGLTRKATQWTTIALGGMTALIAGAAFVQPSAGDPTTMEGRLLPSHMRGEVRWKTILADEIEKGTTVPPHTNVIIQFPDDMKPTSRRVIFGYRGENVRYWGYCFPLNYDRDAALRRSGLPGTIFLSEKERELRKQQQLNGRQDSFSALENKDLGDQKTLNEERLYRGVIRHQQEIFQPGTSCFVMTDTPLPLGTDRDKDLASSAVEKDAGSDPQMADTDADGIKDGLEIFRLGTDPAQRDSDGDGLIDGLEDRNRNGRVDPGETNPTKWDSDKDGLCDGLCKVERGMKLRGEDKNLNGIVDSGESNPLLRDSNGDGIDDFHDVYLCELAGGDNC